MLINFHEELLGIIKLDASSREEGQDSGIKQTRHIARANTTHKSNKTNCNK